MKKRIAILLALTLLAAVTIVSVHASEMWGAVTVKSYEELVTAVNDNGATEIRLSKKYVHGTKSLRTNLVITGGKDVVISGPSEELYQLKGTLDIFGKNGGGSVTLVNIAVTGNDEMPALWVGGKDLTVTVGNLQGGSAARYSGGAGLEAGGSVTVYAEQITGGSTKGSTTGGDGVIAYGNAKVTAKSVTAGNASKGYGGTAVSAAGHASVTVEGDIRAGSGMIVPGFTAVKAPDAEITVTGSQVEGEQYEGKVKLPETANTIAALRYMLLRGDREIALSPKFSAGESQTENVSAPPLFAVCGDAVEISASSPDKKVKCNTGLRFVDGTFHITGMDFSGKKGVTVAGGSVSLECGISLIAKTNSAIRAANDAKVRWIGLIKTNGENSTAVCASDDSEIIVTGDVTAMKSNAIVARDRATVTLNGNAAGGNLKKDKAVYPVLYAQEDAAITVNGNITTKYQGAYAGDNAIIAVRGDLTSSNKSYYCIWVSGNARIGVSGTLTGQYRENDISVFESEEAAEQDTVQSAAENAETGEDPAGEETETAPSEGEPEDREPGQTAGEDPAGEETETAPSEGEPEETEPGQTVEEDPAGEETETDPSEGEPEETEPGQTTESKPDGSDDGTEPAYEETEEV